MDVAELVQKNAVIYPWNTAWTLRLFKNVLPWFRAEIGPVVAIPPSGTGKELLSFRHNKILIDFFPTVCSVWITYVWVLILGPDPILELGFWSPLAPLSCGTKCQNKCARNTACQALNGMRFGVIAGKLVCCFKEAASHVRSCLWCFLLPFFFFSSFGKWAWGRYQKDQWMKC